MDRSKTTARVVSLSSDEAADPRMGGTVDERVAAVTELTLDAWPRLSGRPFPSYTHDTMPIRITTLDQQGQEDEHS